MDIITRRSDFIDLTWYFNMDSVFELDKEKHIRVIWYRVLFGNDSIYKYRWRVMYLYVKHIILWRWKVATIPPATSKWLWFRLVSDRFIYRKLLIVDVSAMILALVTFDCHNILTQMFVTIFCHKYLSQWFPPYVVN